MLLVVLHCRYNLGGLEKKMIAYASSNVAALGKFGDYQVNHFSGLPDISTSLDEVKSGSLNMPITLSYHASGVKPTEIGAWVGTGWPLSTGGQISCNVRGKRLLHISTAIRSNRMPPPVQTLLT